MRLDLVCSRPAVSINTTSILRAFAAACLQQRLAQIVKLLVLGMQGLEIDVGRRRGGDLGKHEFWIALRRILVEQLAGALNIHCPVSGNPIGEITTANIAHDQESTIGVTPVIIKRGNVRMFQPGDELGFTFKSSDKVWLIG